MPEMWMLFVPDEENILTVETGRRDEHDQVCWLASKTSRQREEGLR